MDKTEKYNIASMDIHGSNVIFLRFIHRNLLFIRLNDCLIVYVLNIILLNIDVNRNEKNS